MQQFMYGTSGTNQTETIETYQNHGRTKRFKIKMDQERRSTIPYQCSTRTEVVWRWTDTKRKVSIILSHSFQFLSFVSFLLSNKMRQLKFVHFSNNNTEYVCYYNRFATPYVCHLDTILMGMFQHGWKWFSFDFCSIVICCLLQFMFHRIYINI